jgi:hypothetical protein
MAGALETAKNSPPRPLTPALVKHIDVNVINIHVECSR